MIGLAEALEYDDLQVRRAFAAAAAGFDQAAVLQREVAKRMLERLNLIRLTPTLVVDIGCATGFATAALKQQYSGATVLGIDRVTAMLSQLHRRSSWRYKLRSVCTDAACLPLADASCELVFSNLALPWCGHLETLLSEFFRVLKPNGLFMFSSFGPDTLTELRAAWTAADSQFSTRAYTRVHTFFDMHDIGDALLRARFNDPVMDVERFTLTYANVLTLARDLKQLGAVNATLKRPRGLTSRRRWQALLDAYEAYRHNDILPATAEVVYGHAWAPQTAQLNLRQADGRVSVPLTQLLRRR